MTGRLRLRVLEPTGALVDEAVVKVVAEAPNGSFCLLPKHVDFVAALVPGVLVFARSDGSEGFVGHDEGILVKCGAEVLVSTRSGVTGDDLAGLRAAVERTQRHLGERERAARLALARLEAGIVRRFLEFEGARA
ncbi:MAG TPA: F0F1 ATP synthase subunit epsilon [Thermodesulfobacteriota bacterium]